MSDKLENYALHYAAEQGRVKMCKELLAHQADPNRLNKLLQTPLHLAMKNENLECVQLLIEHGANPYLYDKLGNLPHNYSRVSSAGVKKILVDSEVNPNIKNIHLTSLHQMASAGKTEIVKYLLDRKADVNRLNKNGCSPLHLAMFNGQIECAEMLVDQGAVLNVPGGLKMTPLDFFLIHVFVCFSSDQAASNRNEIEKNFKAQMLKRLRNGWRFSNFETIEFLINTNLKSWSQSFFNQNDLSELQFNQNGESGSKYFSRLKKLKFFLDIVRLSATGARNVVSSFFLCDVANSAIMIMMKKLIVQVLDLVNKIVVESFSQSVEKEISFNREKFSEEFKAYLMRFVKLIVLGGEFVQFKNFIHNVLTSWFQENFRQIETDAGYSKDICYIFRLKYFEKLMEKVAKFLYEPLSLQSLCRIVVKNSICNYPQDLKQLKNSVPNTISNFLAYEN